MHKSCHRRLLHHSHPFFEEPSDEVWLPRPLGLGVGFRVVGVDFSGLLRQPDSAGPDSAGQVKKLLNVSYDPTREFYQEFNAAFAKHWQKETGKKVEIIPSHDGSGKQARSVIGGNEADVVTLALANDIDNIVKNSDGLIDKDWQQRCRTTAPRTLRRSSFWCGGAIRRRSRTGTTC